MKKPTIVLLLTLPLLANFALLQSGCAATPTRESSGEFIDDTAITAKVKAAFIRDDALTSHDITIETYKGIVQLSGFVDTPEQTKLAGKLAAQVPGVRSVQNNLVVKPVSLR